MRILIAEDDDFSRMMLQAMLKTWGYEVIEATNGMEAWEQFQQPDPPRLAILDWMMPGMEGVEVCRRIRSQKTTLPPYLFLLTIREKKEDIVTGLKAGANDYLTKPYDPEELQARLEVGRRMIELQTDLAKRVDELQEAVSERKKAEEELRMAYEELKGLQDNLIQAEKFGALGRFSTGIAHEIKNPLGIILGGVELLQIKIPAGEGNSRKVLNTIKQATLRADGILMQLLKSARTASNSLERVKAKELMENVLAKLRLRQPLGKIRIETLFSPEELYLKVDPEQMTQGLINILINSVEAMPEGGEMRIMTSRETSAENLHKPACAICVADTGEGIPRENLSRIFEPFFTTKRDSRRIGLGLSISKKIIESQQGQIFVRSEREKGTQVKVFLPLEEGMER